MADNLEPNWRSFAPITAYDKAGYIWIAMLYGMTVSILILAIRIWYKQSAFGKDDSLFIAASVAMMAHVVCLIVSLKNGLGASIALSPQDSFSDTKQGTVGSSAMAAYMLFLVALALAKSSTIMFIQRILSRDLKKLFVACYASVLVFAFWAIGSMIAVGTDCDTSKFLSENMSSACPGQAVKWIAIAAIDAATEAILLIMPIFIIWPLQLSFYMKVQVMLAFAFRLGVVAFAITHAVYMNRVPSSPTPEVASVPVIVLAECELCWSLLSATIPNLKAFMKAFNTGFGMDNLKNDISTAIDASGSRTRRGGENNFELQRMSTVRETSQIHDGIHGPASDTYKVEVMSGQLFDDQGSMGSGHSQEMIIHKTVDHEVTYENRKRSLRGTTR